MSELLEKFKQKKDEFLNESNVSQKTKLKEEIDNLLVEIFESKLKTQKADFFNRLENIKNKYSVLPNEKQRNEIIEQEKQKLYKDFDFDLETAEKQLKEFTSGQQVKPFFLWNLYFSEVFYGKGGFDVVIANPPYVKEYTNKNAFDGLRHSPYYQGKMDLWYLFACLTLDFLKENGVLTFIATNNWVTNFGASKMRNKIVNVTQVLKLIDFNNYKIFESAGIQTMIMLFQRNSVVDNYTFDYRKLNENAVDFSNVVGLLNNKKTDENMIFFPAIIKDNFIDKSLIFNNPVVDNVLQTIEKYDNFRLTENEVAQGVVFPQDFLNKKNNEKLGDIYNVGDGIFALSELELNSLNLTEKEKILIKPYFTTNELFQYFGDSNNKYWIIYTSSEFKNPVKMKLYPNIKNHLDKFVKVITSDNKPYGLHRTRNENFFKGEKIISLRKCSDSPFFTYTNFDCYVSATFYVIKTMRANQVFLTGFLNSSLCAFWLRFKGKMQGNNYQIDKEPLLNIPIPVVTEGLQKLIINLVDQILNAKNANPQVNTTVLEREIDQLIYKLYDLTPEEIKIVEGGTK